MKSSTCVKQRTMAEAGLSPIKRKITMTGKKKANNGSTDISKPHQGLQSPVLTERVSAINFLGGRGSRESLALLKEKIKIVHQEYIALMMAIAKLKHKYRVR